MNRFAKKFWTYPYVAHCRKIALLEQTFSEESFLRTALMNMYFEWIRFP